MTKLNSAILSLILFTAAPALAEDTPRRDGPQFGVGVETSLLNISLGNNAVFNPGGAVLLSYDARAWRIEGLFGVLSFNDNTVVRGGGRVLFAVHQTSRSDFSLGLGGYVLHAGENRQQQRFQPERPHEPAPPAQAPGAASGTHPAGPGDRSLARPHRAFCRPA